MNAPVFELRSIDKAFPGVKALDDVSFACAGGEVHALAGENGAGKSTLMKILSGAYQADSGTIILEGEPRNFGHPVEALAAGISVIYQEFALLPDRTVAQNIFLGREPTRRGVLDGDTMRSETARVLKMFGPEHRISPDSIVGELDVAEQQLVEIAKAIALDAKVLVMDEPTAALNENECELLFGLIDKLRDQGRAIVYITHRMPEIARVADRVTVLKDGRVAESFDSVPDSGDIVRAMVGRDIGDFYPPPATEAEVGDIALEVKGGGNDRLDSIDLQLRAGEIVGFAGLQGAGRTALAQALFGVKPFTEGSISIFGKNGHISNPRAAVNAGISMLPGDRKAEGLFLMQSVRDNAMVVARTFSGLFSNRSKTRYGDSEVFDDLLRRVDVRAPDYEVEMGSLSGGNQQKTVVARWLAMKPRILIFIEPTRGIDVNAKASVYHLMRDLARAGAAVMMVSSDLPEVIGASDRIIVMRDGRIVGEFPRGIEESEVMHIATGGSPEEAAA